MDLGREDNLQADKIMLCFVSVQKDCSHYLKKHSCQNSQDWSQNFKVREGWTGLIRVAKRITPRSQTSSEAPNSRATFLKLNGGVLYTKNEELFIV